MRCSIFFYSFVVRPLQLLCCNVNMWWLFTKWSSLNARSLTITCTCHWPTDICKVALQKINLTACWRHTVFAFENIFLRLCCFIYLSTWHLDNTSFLVRKTHVCSRTSFHFVERRTALSRQIITLSREAAPADRGGEGKRFGNYWERHRVQGGLLSSFVCVWKLSFIELPNYNI